MVVAAASMLPALSPPPASLFHSINRAASSGWLPSTSANRRRVRPECCLRGLPGGVVTVHVAPLHCQQAAGPSHCLPSIIKVLCVYVNV